MLDRFHVLGRQEAGRDTRLVGRRVVLVWQEAAVGQPGTPLLERWAQLHLQQVPAIVTRDHGPFRHLMGQHNAFLVPEDSVQDIPAASPW